MEISPERVAGWSFFALVCVAVIVGLCGLWYHIGRQSIDQRTQFIPFPTVHIINMDCQAEAKLP